MRLRIRGKLSHVLWSGFGLLIAIMTLQGGVAVFSLLEVDRSSAKVIKDATVLNQKVAGIRENAASGAIAVEELSGRVQAGLAKKMKDGESDLKLLERSVGDLVTSTGDIIKQL